MLKHRAQLWLLIGGLAVHLLSIPVLRLDPLMGDAKQLNSEANSIVDGLGWKNTEGPGRATITYPAQVIFLLACKMIFGRDVHAAPVIIQHLFVIFTALLVYRLAMGAGMGRTVALLSEAIVLFFPHTWYWANVLNSHTLGMLLGVLGVFLLMKKPKRGSAYITIGIVWGAATLARFSYQYFVPVWIMAMLVAEIRSNRKISLGSLSRAGFLVIGFLIVLVPWIVRVHKYAGGTSGYPDAWRICYSFNRLPEVRGNDRDEFQTKLEGDSTLTPSEREAIYKKRVFQNLREHPDWFVNNWLTNLGLLLINVTTKWEQPHYALYAGMYYCLLLTFGLLGLLSLSRSQHAGFLPAYLLGVVIFAVHVPIYGYISNSSPVWAVFAPIVATGADLSFRAASMKRKGPHEPA